MPDFARDFGPFGDRIWLNCSHQGPIPRSAAAAAREAVDMKVSPFRFVEPGLFQEVPRRLRTALARLVNVDADDVILGNSTSYGMSLIAQGLDWRPGDEVVVVEGDFPATLFPWLVLEDRGVSVRRIQPAGDRLERADLERELRPNTRVCCTTWVHSFKGHALDAAPLASACRANETIFVLNASQGLGARSFDVRAAGVDVVSSCGFKYLCGPYATGFSWIRPELRNSLKPPKGYWLANLTADDLAGDFKPALRPDAGARIFDVNGTANFFNFMTWAASVEYLLEQGIERIAAWDQELVSQLIAGLRDQRWAITSPLEGPHRTTLTVFAGGSAEQTDGAFQALRDGRVYAAMRRGQIRISPHLFNTADDIAAALAALEPCASRGNALN